MPIRVPMQSVAVVRDKARVDPKIGEPFEFTQDEIDHINAVNPDALSNLVTVAAEDIDAGKPVKVAGKKAAKPAEDI